MGPEIDLVQFIKDFEVTSILFIFVFMYLLNRKAGEIKKENHKDYEALKEDINNRFEKMSKKADTRNQVFWEKINKQNIRIHGLETKTALLDRDVTYLREGK